MTQSPERSSESEATKTFGDGLDGAAGGSGSLVSCGASRDMLSGALPNRLRAAIEPIAIGEAGSRRPASIALGCSAPGALLVTNSLRRLRFVGGNLSKLTNVIGRRWNLPPVCAATGDAGEGTSQRSEPPLGVYRTAGSRSDG